MMILWRGIYPREIKSMSLICHSHKGWRNKITVEWSRPVDGEEMISQDFIIPKAENLLLEPNSRHVIVSGLRKILL